MGVPSKEVLEHRYRGFCTWRTKSRRPRADLLIRLPSAESPWPSVKRQIADSAVWEARCTPASSSSSSLVSFVSSVGTV